MTIIMSYHTLIDRDSKFVSSKWRTSIIVILLAICICSFMGAFNIHYLLENFNHNCIISATVNFKQREHNFYRKPNTDQSTETPFIFTNTDANNQDIVSSTTNRLDNSNLDNNDNDNKNIKRRSLVQKNLQESVNGKTIPESFLKYNTEDASFFINREIDELHTYWGKDKHCDYTKTFPLFVGFCSVIWIAMFLICGKGGHTSATMPRPWRIVIPASIFFFLMVIAEITNAMFVRHITNSFCNQIQSKLSANYSCMELFEKFSFLHNGEYSPAGRNYSIVLISSWISAALWLLLLVIMIFRIIFVIDFQLVRVTVSKNPSEKKNVQFIKEYNASNFLDEDDIDDETSFTTALGAGNSYETAHEMEYTDETSNKYV